ncbi:MAG: TonB-dependent receptor [Candidatus Zixiibacteriota bacterium]
MKKSCLVFSLLTVLLVVASIWAGTTGKITGVATDSKTNEPLVGASITVVGSTMGAQTDVDGHFTIQNVPVGTYVLRFSAVGFTTVEVSNVSVSVDMASYVDQAMTEQVTELGEVIRVTAEAPLLVKDKTSSVTVVKKEKLEAMPVRGLQQVVAQQNSVVQTRGFVSTSVRGDREGINGGEINLRGGRPSEVAYFVDGFSTQDPLTGASTATIASNSVKEISVQAGGFPAEYGNVSSGIINTTTLSGSDKLQGVVELRTDNTQKQSGNQNWYGGSLNGPIPIAERMYFSVSGERRWLGDRNLSAITHDVIPGDRYDLPNNTSQGYSYSGKVDWGISPNIKFSGALSSSREKWSQYLHSYLFNRAHMPYTDDETFGLNGRVTHTLNSKTFYNLNVSYSDIKKFRGDGVHREDINAYVRAVNPNFESHSLFWTTGHVWDDFLRRRSQTVELSGDITTEIQKVHSFKLGVQYQRMTLRYYRHLQPVDIDYNFDDLDRYGYDSVGNESENSGTRDGAKHPINIALFAQDRIEWRGMIVNAGLRFEYFDYKAKRIKNMVNPFNPDGLPDPNSSVLDDGDLENSEKFKRLSPRLGISFPVTDKTKLHFNFGKFYQRPDLQYLYVGYRYYEFKLTQAGYYYPIGNPNLVPEKTTAYEVGFEHLLSENTRLGLTAYLKDVSDQVQVYNQAAPAAGIQYATFQNSDYGTVKGVELALEMKRTENVSFDVKYTLQSAEGTGSYANTARNTAWTDADAPKQMAPLDYDQRHKLTGNIDWRFGKGEGPLLGTTRFLENFGMNILVNAGSGLPYSPQEIYNEVTLASVSPTPAARRNSGYGPWTMTVDLKMSKSFVFGNYSLKPYIEVRNVFDRDNVIGVFESSGRANSTGFLDTPTGQQTANNPTTGLVPNAFGQTYTQAYSLKENNPENYGPPRQIFVGVTASF